MAAPSAHAVAAELRKRLPEAGKVKMHKLLYYAQGHHLATFGTPLFSESIEAWDMGPVVAMLWREEEEGTPDYLASALGEAELNTIGYVVSRYGALSGQDLKHLTHSERPWAEADQRRALGKSTKIPAEVMQDYFTSAAEDNDEDLPPLPAAAVAALLDGARERLTKPARRDSVKELRSRLTSSNR